MIPGLCILSVLCSVGLQTKSPVDAGGDPWNVQRLLEYHLGLKRQISARDVYKLFYQAAFGVEHLLTDTAGVQGYLGEELSRLDTLKQDEPLLERISTDGAMVRVNLRPFKALNLSPRLLVQAMFHSAAETRPDTLLFMRLWHEYSSLVRYGVVRPVPADLEEWDARVERGDLVPVHHSQGYTEVNRPAYRVVRRSVIESIFREQGIQ